MSCLTLKTSYSFPLEASQQEAEKRAESRTENKPTDHVAFVMSAEAHSTPPDKACSTQACRDAQPRCRKGDGARSSCQCVTRWETCRSRSADHAVWERGCLRPLSIEHFLEHGIDAKDAEAHDAKTHRCSQWRLLAAQHADAFENSNAKAEVGKD